MPANSMLGMTKGTVTAAVMRARKLPDSEDFRAVLVEVTSLFYMNHLRL